MHAVLIDDSRSILVALGQELEKVPDLVVDSFLDPQQAINACQNRQYDMVLVDYNMPKLNGIDVVTILRAMSGYDLVPIIMITSMRETSVRLNALEAGVTEFLTKPVESLELNVRVRNLLNLRKSQVELAQRADDLIEAVNIKTAALAKSEEEIIWRLARAIEYRDGNTGDHVSRVARIAMLMAREMGLSEPLCRMIYLATPLHDVGKIGIPDHILSKPGSLTEEELGIMRQHVEIGVRILENGQSDLLQVAERIAGGHHEKWDGSGYPYGLKGNSIPLEARIVALADVFDALCAERPYKPAWTLEKARKHVHNEKGRHFDPACVDVFERLWPQVVKIMSGQEQTDNLIMDKVPPLAPHELNQTASSLQTVGGRY